MIKILIVDDSKTECLLLKKIFESQEDMHVIGIAHDGKEAVEMTALLKPDIVTMDLEMPVMDGHTATRLIMSQHPVPIVVISAKLDDTSADMTFLALEAGAVSVISKPNNVIGKGFSSSEKKMIETIRSMAEIKVIKRRFKSLTPSQKTPVLPEKKYKPSDYFEIIAIGTSVGGPQTLKKLLSQLPADFPVPIVIVQHISTGFIDGFAKWLNNNISLKVKLAENNEILKKGIIYFAPDNAHFTVTRANGELMSQLISGEPVSGFYPSITVLLNSIAKTSGKNAIGILLTGMGSDGADGLLKLKQANGHTLIQDEKSCVVFGMASVANSLGAVDQCIEIDRMADYLIKTTKSRP